jgi:hypothetical protein
MGSRCKKSKDDNSAYSLKRLKGDIIKFKDKMKAVQQVIQIVQS